MDCISIFCILGLFVSLIVVSLLQIGIVGWIIDIVNKLLERPNPASDDDDDDYEDIWYPFD